MKRTIALAISLVFTTPVFAGGEASPHMRKHFGPTQNSFSASTSKATSLAAAGAVANPTAILNSTGGSTTFNSTNKTNAYSYTKSALTTSQGLCPLLGSVDLFIVSGTYEISKCAMWRDVELMTSVKDAQNKQVFSLESVMNRICQEQSIAEVSSECTNRTISRQ